MKFLLILSTVIALADSSCPAPSTCPCGDFTELTNFEPVPNQGPGCSSNLTCVERILYASSFVNTSNIPLPEGYDMITIDGATGNLMDSYGIVCEKATWYMTKFPGTVKLVNSTTHSEKELDAAEWVGKGYKAALYGINCF